MPLSGWKDDHFYQDGVAVCEILKPKRYEYTRKSCNVCHSLYKEWRAELK